MIRYTFFYNKTLQVLGYFSVLGDEYSLQELFR